MSHDPSDVELGQQVAETLSVPRRDRADSFVLHAPLELLARLALLPRVRPEHRAAARDRIHGIGTRFDAFGPPIDPGLPTSFDSASAAATRLLDAIDRKELADADSSAGWLGEHVTPTGLGRLLGDALAPRLAAAGHAPIFLMHWPRVSPRGELTATMMRQLVRGLAQSPELRIGWIGRPTPRGEGNGASLSSVLGTTPPLGPPEVDFIDPIMDRVDHDETAARLAPVTLGGDPSGRGAAAREIQRVAAWSMVLEPGAAAPYLWSHCLTMPQAVLSLLPVSADPGRVLAVAATHVTGFRAAYATKALAARYDVPAPELPLRDALDSGQELATAVAWHTHPEHRPALIDELVQRAAVHEDAHLVKYTLACLDAAASDPDAARLYLTAAASLSGWWSTNSDPTA